MNETHSFTKKLNPETDQMGRPKKLPIPTRFYTPTSSKEKLPSFVWKHILKILVSVKIIYKNRERPISHLFLVLTSSEWETTVFLVPNSILHWSQPNKNPKSDWRNLFSPWPACVTEVCKSVLYIFHEHCSKIDRENTTRGSERRRNAQQQQAMAPLLRATSRTHRRTSGNKDGNTNTCTRGESIRTNKDGNSNTCMGGESIRTKWDGNANTYIGGDSVRANKDGNGNTWVFVQKRDGNLNTRIRGVYTYKHGWERENRYQVKVYVQNSVCTYPPVPNKTKVVPNMVAGNGVSFTPFGYQKFVYILRISVFA
jgi:hypothetical protein